VGARKYRECEKTKKSLAFIADYNSFLILSIRILHRPADGLMSAERIVLLKEFSRKLFSSPGDS
jgi:hypothetical protein